MMNQLIAGMRLTDSYRYVDDCINEVTLSVDGLADFENAKIDHEFEVQ